MITQRFAVEFERRTVGVAARVGGGFIFYASDDRFSEMDGRVFPRARAIERQLKRVAKKGARKAHALQANPSLA
jgi:hypothetical protein